MESREAATQPSIDRALFSVAEAARTLGVNRATVWRWIREGRLPAARPGPRTIRVKGADLEALLADGRLTGLAEAQPSSVDQELIEQHPQLIDLAHDAILVLGLDGRIFHWNRGAEELYGWSREEAIGKLAPELLTTRFPISLEAAREAVLTTGRWEGELIHTSRDGRTLVVESRWALQRAADGTPIAAVEINRDVTQHRLTEARYRALFDQSVDPIIVTDEQGQFLETNQAALDLLGYTIEELQEAMSTNRMVVAADPDLAREQFAQLRRAGEWRGELELRRKDGSIVPVEAHVRWVALPTGGVYLGSWRDISARRARIEQQRQFIATTTHELRNPISGIKGFTQLMRRRGSLDERMIEAILRQTDQLERLTEDLGTLSTLESGRLRLERQQVDLAELIQISAQQAQTSSAEHTIRLELPDQPVEGSWDPQRIGQVLNNLLSNAIKYSPDGSEIVVRLQDEGGEVQLTVQDHGLGISADELPKLFERFYRVGSTALKAHGIGLGLYICRGLVEAHGGRIWAESDGEGQGSSFQVRLLT